MTSQERDEELLREDELIKTYDPFRQEAELLRRQEADETKLHTAEEASAYIADATTREPFNPPLVDLTPSESMTPIWDEFDEANQKLFDQWEAAALRIEGIMKEGLQRIQEVFDGR